MGLDCSHDCWHGAYSAFMRWRIAVAKAAGIPLMLMEGFWALDAFKVEVMNRNLPTKEAHCSDYKKATQQFIDGLKLAAKRKEPVRFA